MQDPYFHRKILERDSATRWKRWLGAGLGLLALAILTYNVPWVNERLGWRIDSLKTNIIYFFNPPEEAVFVPQGQAASAATASALALTPRSSSTPVLTPQPTSPPLPASVRLEDFTYVDQHNRWNYCGPANLTMALNFWGWQGNRDDVAASVKPGINNKPNSKEDKNVMPYEMEDFVETQVAGMQAVVRMGGELNELKTLIAAGFPVIVEKGYYTTTAAGDFSWLGHYQFVTGYDDAAGVFIVQDTYETGGENGTGKNMQWTYGDFQKAWRDFNYLFIVVYPDSQYDAVVKALGPWVDDDWANHHALDLAMAESQSLSGVDLYYAWFNIGTSHVRLMEYVDAANAYDYAFALYAQLPPDDSIRPFRMMWYQTWPYWAYYYSGRYQDVINLVNETFDTIADDTLEESFYWRGMAFNAIGETDNAIADFREALRLHPGFVPALQALEQLGLNG